MIIWENGIPQEISPPVFHQLSLDISSEQILNMVDEPILLLSAPNADEVLSINQFVAVYNAGSIMYSLDADFRINFGVDTSDDQYKMYGNSPAISNMLLNNYSSVLIASNNTGDFSGLTFRQGLGLYLAALPLANIRDGNGTFSISITYAPISIN